MAGDSMEEAGITNSKNILDNIESSGMTREGSVDQLNQSLEKNILTQKTSEHSWII
jgi:hypothetical protein